jgi:hypothetical protein
MPCALNQIRQSALFNDRETHQNPRVIPVVIGNKEGVRSGLHQNLASHKAPPIARADCGYLSAA